MNDENEKSKKMEMMQKVETFSIIDMKPVIKFLCLKNKKITRHVYVTNLTWVSFYKKTSCKYFSNVKLES